MTHHGRRPTTTASRVLASRVLVGLALGLGLGLVSSLLAGPAHAQQGGAMFQGLASDLFDRAADDYDVGLGFNLSGDYRLHSQFGVRADLGFRWIEGEDTVIGTAAEPDLGGRPGERTEGLRLIPITAGIVYRIEQWSQGAFWVPYVSAGLGFYDIRATYTGEDGLERNSDLFETGWHGRVGVNFHRTSGLFVNVESAVHLVDTPGRWTPLYDISFGVGTVVPLPE